MVRINKQIKRLKRLLQLHEGETVKERSLRDQVKNLESRKNN